MITTPRAQGNAIIGIKKAQKKVICQSSLARKWQSYDQTQMHIDSKALI